MICDYLSDFLGLKCLRLGEVSHTLTVDEKAKRAQYAEAMLDILAGHKSARFHFLYTGDESWLLYSDHERTRSVAWSDNAPIVERPSHSHMQTMFSVFFNGTGQFLIDILPECMEMDTDYFAENIINQMVRLSYIQGRRSRERRVMLHFDNARIHSSCTVWDRMGWQNWNGWSTRHMTQIWRLVISFSLHV
jgi:hypothetical protein